MIQAKIYKPAKTAMQSGRAKTKQWLLEFIPTEELSSSAPMGWASGGDILQQVRLRFDTLEKAIAYAKNQGLSYFVEEPHYAKPKPKSYADNFKFDRVL